MNLTLVSPALPEAAVERVSALLGRAPDARGADRVRWLRAAQAPAPEPRLRDAVAEICGPQQVDFAFLPAGLRLEDFALLAMDMDSTLISIECIDEIADFAGRKREVAAITEAAMRGEISDFAESLRRRVALLEGVPEGALDSVYAERLRLNPGAQELVRAAQAAGLKTLLVSGGFSFFTDRLRERLGLDFVRSNRLEVIDGRLTGRVLGDIVDAQAKADEMLRACALLGAPATRAIAIGDGANDLLMMRAAGLSVAYHAKPVVRAQTTAAINAGGLDVLLRWID